MGLFADRDGLKALRDGEHVVRMATSVGLMCTERLPYGEPNSERWYYRHCAEFPLLQGKTIEDLFGSNGILERARNEAALRQARENDIDINILTRPEGGYRVKIVVRRRMEAEVLFTATVRVTDTEIAIEDPPP